jgi:hypothetical protein
MFNLNVLQNQWLILALMSGVIIMLGVAMTYLMMWRPRKDGVEVISSLRSLFRLLPLILIILFVCILIYQITYVIIFAVNPPNL